MGGRGSSGGSSISNRLPEPVKFDIKTMFLNMPALEGTEKQVAWANKIRNSIVQEIASYATRRDSEGRPSTMVYTYLGGKSAMEKSVKDELTDYMSGATKARVISNRIETFKDAKVRLERLHSISREKSAKFWIENRTDSEKNYMNKALKKRIDGK